MGFYPVTLYESHAQVNAVVSKDLTFGTANASAFQPGGEVDYPLSMHGLAPPETGTGASLFHSLTNPPVRAVVWENPLDASA